jgi:hypothetical protein
MAAEQDQGLARRRRALKFATLGSLLRARSRKLLRSRSMSKIRLRILAARISHKTTAKKQSAIERSFYYLYATLETSD